MPIQFNSKSQQGEKWIEANVVLTAFGRRKLDKYIKIKEESNKILYNKNSSSLQVISRGQFPSDFNNDKLSTNSILNRNAFVNTNNEKNTLNEGKKDIRYALSESTDDLTAQQIKDRQNAR